MNTGFTRLFLLSSVSAPSDHNHALVHSGSCRPVVSPPFSLSISFSSPKQSSSVVGILGDDVDPMVNVMKVDKAPTESYADVGGLEAQIQEIKEVG